MSSLGERKREEVRRVQLRRQSEREGERSRNGKLTQQPRTHLPSQGSRDRCSTRSSTPQISTPQIPSLQLLLLLQQFLPHQRRPNLLPLLQRHPPRVPSVVRSLLRFSSQVGEPKAGEVSCFSSTLGRKGEGFEASRAEEEWVRVEKKSWWKLEVERRRVWLLSCFGRWRWAI